MKPPVLILRPEPGATTTHAAALALGLEAAAFPLFAATPGDWDAPAPGEFDAILLGSANALRHGGATLGAYAGLPAYCVGAVTADAARAAGLDVISVGEGGLQAVLAAVAPAHRRLLRLSGRDRVALTPPAEVSLIERTVYASIAQPFPVELSRLLLTRALPDVVMLLHSGEAARHVIAECARLHIGRERITAVAIGPRVAAICDAGGGWAAVHTADRPSDAGVLALAVQLCQSIDCNKMGRPNA